MKKFFVKIRNDIKTLRLSCEINKKEIFAENIKALKFVSLFSTIVLAILFSASLFPTELSVFRWIYGTYFFSLVVLTFCIFSFNKKEISSRIYIALSYLIIFSLGMIISLMPKNLSYPTVVLFVFLISVPMLYIEKPWTKILTISFYSIVYFILIHLFKSQSVVFLDSLDLWVSATISIALSFYFNKIRLQEISLKKSLFIEVNTDELTTLANRRKLDDIIKMVDANFVNDEDIGAIILDIDSFKQYNDTYGHLQGDVCLETVSSTLNEIAVKNDFVLARFGGEEFAGIIQNTDLYQMQKIADEMLNAVRNLKLEHINSPKKIITISIGYDTKKHCGADDSAKLIEFADGALYYAKTHGRNQSQTSRKKT